MARDLQSGDRISLGSDASVDDILARVILMYVRSSPGAGQAGMQFGKGTPWTFDTQRGVIGETNQHLRLIQGWTITDGTWVTANNSITNGAATAIGMTYHRGAVGNNPTFYIDGASSTATETSPPSGSADSDAASTLQFDGTINGFAVGFLVMDDFNLTAADANRHRWWGMAPGGPSTVLIHHPMWTSETANKGSATADMSLTGTTMTSLAKVMRPGCGGF